MSLNYITEEKTVIPAKVYSDPYLRAEIEQIDHDYTHYQSLAGWTRSHSLSCKSSAWNGTNMLWLDPKSTYSSVDLSQKIDIVSEGWYRVYIKVRRGPTNKGKVRLYVDNSLIDEPYEAYYSNYHWKFVDFGLTYLNTGSRSFKVTLDKNVGVGTFFLYKVNKHDSYNIPDYSRKLDIQSLQFTQNSVNELNTLEMPITLKDEYYDEDSPSRFIFDGYTNAITVWMGEDRKSAKSMFGGYITGLTDSYSDDLGYTLTVKGADRLLDFYREPVYMNFEVNTHVKSDDSKIFPYVYKHNIYETIRYLAETNEEGINTSGLEAPYVFYWDFSDRKEFDRLQVSRYTKVWDKKVGNPKPCLRLGVGKRKGKGSVVLYDNEENPFDANIYNIFAFNYIYSKRSAKYPTQFHIAIDMYRDGEDPDHPTTYYITFNSKPGSSNIIKQIKPVYNGQWQSVKIDLRSAFDDYAPASNYYITGIRLEDDISSNQVKNRTHSSIWLDNLTVYDDVANVKANIDQEGSYPFELFQKLCEEGDYGLWVDYGNERREDVLVLRSNYDDISEINALPYNTIQIGDVEYNMYDHNVRNIARRIYHPTTKTKKKVSHIVKNKPSKRKYKITYVETKSGKKEKRYEYFTYKYVKAVNPSDLDKIQSSYRRYRGWEDFQDMTDTTKEVDAHHDAQVFLNDHNEAPYGFTIAVRGSTLLNPNQYLFVEENRRRLTGLHKIKTITHNYDSTATDKWQTQIDCGIASRRFRNMILNMKRNINKLDGKSKHIKYTADQLNDLGSSSPGVFI